MSDDEDIQKEFVDRMEKAVEDAANKLGAIADSVQIVVTHLDPVTKETFTVSRGFGNWYARTGSVRTWLLRVDEDVRMDMRKDEE